jgi:hypothetical protein
MKKGLILLPFAVASSQLSADVLADMFGNGKITGEWRTFYIDRDRHGAVGNAQQDTSGLSTGGFLKYESGSVGGLSTAFAFYTTSPLDENPSHREPSLSGEGKKGYTLLGEAYLQYVSNSGNVIKVGRQKLDTPLAGSDDVRMLPNLFEAAVFQTNHVPDSTLILAHVTRFSAGSFSNIYGSDMLSISSGYGLNNVSGEFMDMGTYAVNKNTDGVSTLGLINKSLPNTKIQFWDYYAHDILNAIYVQADFSQKMDGFSPFASIQYINEQSIGDEFGGEVESNYYGLKVGATVNSFTISGAYSSTGSSDDKVGTILSPWGGMPAFTQGMVARHQFFEDTTATKFAGTYKFKEATGHDISLTGYLTSYSVGEKNGWKPNENWTTRESGFDLIYKPVTNLTLRLRGNYPLSFYEKPNGDTLSWDETRVIVSYKF